VAWDADGNQLAALAGLDGSVIGGEAECRGAGERRAMQQLASWNVRRKLPQIRKFSEQVEVFDARQAVSADRDANARGKELINWRNPGAGPSIAARAGDECRAGVGETRQF